MVYARICDRMLLIFTSSKGKPAINMQIFAVSKVSGGPNCNRNVSSETETYEAN